MSLPKGFKRLEYIQSSGTQYIDTGVVPKANPQVNMVATLFNDDNREMFGTAIRETPCWILNFEDGVIYYRYYINSPVTATYVVGNIVGNKLEYNIGQTLAIGGVTYCTAAAADFSAFAQTLRLFAAREQTDESYNASMQLYSCQIYDNGTLVRDFIPCQNASGTVGLYDRVFHEFYRNAGTGEFIAGSEVQTVPKSPANFRVESATDTLVTLAWDESDKAVGYRLYKSGQLLADTTETSVSVTVEPSVKVVFTLTAYNENGESAGTELTYFSASDNPILFLVTDRTQQDVALGNTKGTYNASDLNRVGYAVVYLADQLASCGVKTTVHPKTDWMTTDIPSEQVLVTYLQNVRTLRTALTLVASAPEVPQDMQFFTHTEANGIEMLLVMLDTHITNMLSNVDTSWAVGSTHTGLYAKEAYR